MIQHNMENVLHPCDCLPSSAAAAYHCCQVLRSDQVSLQQVQADSSTEALQNGAPFTTCSIQYIVQFKTTLYDCVLSHNISMLQAYYQALHINVSFGTCI